MLGVNNTSVALGVLRLTVNSSVPPSSTVASFTVIVAVSLSVMVPVPVALALAVLPLVTVAVKVNASSFSSKIS